MAASQGSSRSSAPALKWLRETQGPTAYSTQIVFEVSQHRFGAIPVGTLRLRYDALHEINASPNRPSFVGGPSSRSAVAATKNVGQNVAHGIGGFRSGRLLRHSFGLASLVLREDHLRLSEAGWADLHRAICDGFQFCIVCWIATNIASAQAP